MGDSKRFAISGVAKAFGPGILFAGAAIGTSHLYWSTRAGAKYGFALVWVVVLANFFKYPFFDLLRFCGSLVPLEASIFINSTENIICSFNFAFCFSDETGPLQIVFRAIQFGLKVSQAVLRAIQCITVTPNQRVRRLKIVWYTQDMAGEVNPRLL